MRRSKRRAMEAGVLTRLAALLLLPIVAHVALPSAYAALPGSQTQTLLRLQKLLENPSALSSWDSNTTFCSIQPSASVNVSCSTDDAGSQSVIVLQIVGDKKSISVEQKLSANYTESQVRLSDGFSAQALANSLLKFPDLRVLSLVSLGIWGLVPPSIDRLRSLQVLNLSSNFFASSVPDRYSALGSLQSLALDNNILTGAFPASLNVLPNLDTLDLSNNRLTGTIPTQLSLFTSLKLLKLDHNVFFGELPASVSNLRSLETLSMSDNLLAGEVPNISGMENLRVLDLGNNQLGPSFPELGPKLVSVKLSRNRLSGPIPDTFQAFSDLRLLNLSINQLSGAPPSGLFSLPSIQNLGLDHNRLSGTLSSDLALGGNLTVLDISSNLFMGQLPKELNATTSNRTIRFDENCFSEQEHQQPDAYCIKAQQMTPVSSGSGGSSPQPGDGKGRRWKGGVVAGIAGGVMALGAAATVLLLILLRFSKQGKFKNAAAHCGASSCADTGSVGIPAELLQNTRYLAHSGGVGAPGPPQCRIFSMGELEEATNGFSQAALIGEGEYAKVFKGKLDDGTLVAVKCINVDPKQDMKQLKSHLEFLSRIRHRHLVSLFGYCLEREKDGQQSRRLFLVSEFIDNGTLRSHLFKRRLKESLMWSNRLVAVLGAGRGIHYLHTGVVPGIFNNDVRITNILLDENLVAKVSDFGLARHADDSYASDQATLFTQNAVTYFDLDHHHRKLATDKKDVYNFGLILLEVVLGRPPTIDNPKAVRPKVQELEMMMTDSVFRTEMVDSAIAGTCSEDSLSTVLEIAAKCLSDDSASRPSMEDVLWNLQYAVQVQERRLSGEYPEELNGYAKE